MRANVHHFRTRMSGLSLIELLVAMALSLLLLAGVLTMFTGSRNTYEVNDRIARVQENGRFALDSIARDSRSSGYVGCASKLPEGVQAFSALNKPAGMPTAVAFGADFAVTGYNYMSPGVWSPALDTTGWASPPADGSDVLLILEPRPGIQSLQVVESMTKTTDDVHVTPIASGNGPYSAGQIMMLAGCTMRSYFQITAYDAKNGVLEHKQQAADSNHPGNATDDLNYAYAGTDQPASNKGYADILAMQTAVYYVRPGTANNGNSLWRRIDGLAPEEIVEGVDAMHLRYGVDTTGDRIVDAYVPANLVTNPNTIVSVEIALLARSIDEYGTLQSDSKTYTLLDTTFDAPGDHRLRQVFSTTLTLRNAVK